MMHERGKSDPNIDTMGQSAARCGTIGATKTSDKELPHA